MRNLCFGLFLAICSINIQSQTVAPQKAAGSRYSFTFKNVYFEVDPSYGGRISSLKVSDKSILNGTNAGTDYGSTFWPSPQYPSPANWGWPPLAELDNLAYTVKVDGYKLTMKSKKNATYKISCSKVFWVDDRDTSISITYYLKNENTVAKSYAPWEVTRVPAGGLTLFAKGGTSYTGDMASSMKDSLNTVWYNQNVKQASGNKIFCDGMGWLAHVNPSNKVFVKVFENIKATNAAPGEAEIEIYTASDHSYTELEDQGAYVSIPAGDSIAWRVRWYVRDLPSGITVKIGEQKLLDFVSSIGNKPILKDTNIVVPEKVAYINKASVEIFPNPANTEIKISGLAQNESQTVTLFNLQGAVVLKSVVSINNSAINISMLKSGSYLYEVSNNFQQASKGILLISK